MSKGKDFLEVEDFKEKLKKDDKVENVNLRKRFNVEVKVPEDEEGRVIEVIASTDARDRDGDTINPEGWDLSDYEKNPQFIWCHDYQSLPLGRALSTWVQNGELRQKIEFAPKEANPMAEQVYLLYKNNFLNAVSVGFTPVDFEYSDEENAGIDFKEQKLLEVSAVPIPSNPEALMVAGKEGIDTSVIKNWAKDVLDKTETEQATKAEDVELEINPVFDEKNINKEGLIFGKENCPHCEGKLYMKLNPGLLNSEKDGRVLSTRNQELLEEAREDIDKVLKYCDDDDKEYIEQLEKEVDDLKKQLKSEESDYIEFEEGIFDSITEEKSDEIDIDPDEVYTMVQEKVKEAVKNKTGKIL